MSDESELSAFGDLTQSEHRLLDRVLTSLRRPLIAPSKNVGNNWLFSNNEYEYMSSLIKLHHTFSTGNFDKRRFENGLHECLNESGRERCVLSPPGYPGADMMIDNERISCKTEGARAIKKDQVHISKWMEMGSADWSNTTNLIDSFLTHSTRYDKVIILRSLHGNPRNVDPGTYHYQLLELPLENLRNCISKGTVRIPKSKQNPNPVYVDCEINSKPFQFYFDGGTECKLQLKKLPVSECTVIANWSFQETNDIE